MLFAIYTHKPPLFQMSEEFALQFIPFQKINETKMIPLVFFSSFGGDESSGLCFSSFLGTEVGFLFLSDVFLVCDIK